MGGPQQPPNSPFGLFTLNEEPTFGAQFLLCSHNNAAGHAARNDPDEEKLPCILFLHGASGRGDPSGVVKWALPRLINDGDAVLAAFPCVVVAPVLSLQRTEFNAQQAMAILETVLTDHGCDRSRVFVTGLSMGGLGAYMMAAHYPDVFAAVVPMCGGGHPVFAPLLSELPFWFFHAQNDNVIGVEETDALVEALRAAGNVSVNYTRYEECTACCCSDWMVGHNCFDQAYASPALWLWLSRQRRRPRSASGSESPTDACMEKKSGR